MSRWRFARICSIRLFQLTCAPLLWISSPIVNSTFATGYMARMYLR
jgi:hypothetical protein